MPVVVNPKKCLDRGHCYAAAACPYDAYLHNNLRNTWEVDASKCGDCPAPCINVCDQYAVVWAESVSHAGLLKQQFAGELTATEVEELRLKRRQEEAAAAERKRQEDAKKQGKPIDITAATFKSEVVDSELPVLLDCWAEWCGPCKQMAPIFAQLAGQYAGVVKFAKLDTDKEPAVARSLGIRALPTLMFFYKGQLVDAVQGALPGQQMQAWINQVLNALRQMEDATAAGDPAAQPQGQGPAGLILSDAPAAPAPQPAPPAGQAQAQRKKPRIYLP